MQTAQAGGATRQQAVGRCGAWPQWLRRAPSTVGRYCVDNNPRGDVRNLTDSTGAIRLYRGASEISADLGKEDPGWKPVLVPTRHPRATIRLKTFSSDVFGSTTGS